LVWLGTAEEKTAHLTTLLRLELTDLPHVVIGNGEARTVRYFPDRLPIGIHPAGRGVVVYVVTEPWLDEFRVFLVWHAALLQALPAWTLRIVVPPHFPDAGQRANQAVWNQLMSPLNPEILEELRWYFEQARAHSAPSRCPDLDARFSQGPNGVYANHITAGWFRTLGTKILTGREFTTSDRIGSPGVVIVNQAFAERFLKNPNPLGRTIFQRSDPDGPRELLEIVGVAENAMYRFIKEPAPPTIYTPLAQMPDPLPATINLSIRAEGIPAPALSRSIAEKVLAVERDAALTFRTLSDQVAAQYAQERLVAWIATIFGGLAVLLAALGLYGIAAYAVVRRRAEIGIRMALGAAPGSVVRLVLARVITLIAAGVLCGLVGSVWTTQFTKSMLYNVEPGDTATLIGSCALLIAVAFVAAWLPGRRAARIDPASVLKDAY
jgi:hypothetical protein